MLECKISVCLYSYRLIGGGGGGDCLGVNFYVPAEIQKRSK